MKYPSTMGNFTYYIFLVALVLTPAVSHSDTEGQTGCRNCSVSSKNTQKLDNELKEISSKLSGYKTCDGTQKGIASVYGIRGRDNFAGKKTASGEVMRPEKLRAATLKSARRQYPLGTWVKVSNGDRSVILCINDTGGGHAGRIIDLSSAASKAIGNGDLGQVEVECLIKPVKGMKRCDDRVASLIQSE